MKCETFRFDEVTINFDKMRVPLSGKQRSKRQGCYRYYGAQGIIDFVDDYIFDGTYLLLAEDGENLKSKKQNIAQVVKGKFWVNNHAHIVQTNEQCNLFYLCYLINNMDLSGYITGSAQPKLSQTNLNAVTFQLPSIEKQNKIVSVLSAFDDKIECNNKINENLQQQAQAIYENMFSGFRSSPVELSNIIDVRDGTHNSPKAESEGYPLITSKHLLPFSVDRASANRISKDDYEKINERSLVETQDILMSMIGTIGLISYVSYPVVDFAIKNVALFKTSHSPEFAYYILCYLKSNATKQYIEKHLAGSTQKYISLRELRKMPVYQPSNTELEKFNFLVKPMFEDIVLRVNENIYLSEIRNTLLPKLMNGEIDIDGI